MVRRQIPAWRDLIAPEDRALLDTRVDPEQWYPMETSERLGLLILQHVVNGETDAIRLWGRTQVQTIIGFFPQLSTRDEPMDAVVQLQNVLASLFDFPAVTVERLEAERAVLCVAYGMSPPAEEAVSWQTVGFFEELLTASGAREVSGTLSSRSWADSDTTRISLSWLSKRATPRPFFAPTRLLLVEDEHLVAKGLMRMLAKSAQCTVAASADEALAMLETQTFDAVLSDFHMPGRDGLSLLEEVSRRWPDTKRILHSGSMPVRAKAAVARGEVHVLLDKPVARDVLMAAVSNP
jgi:CheY-like chemotaxis protein